MNAQAKGKYVNCTRRIDEVRMKNIISQCPKKNTIHMVKVFVEHIL